MAPKRTTSKSKKEAVTPKGKEKDAEVETNTESISSPPDLNESAGTVVKSSASKRKSVKSTKSVLEIDQSVTEDVHATTGTDLVSVNFSVLLVSFNNYIIIFEI